MPRRWIARIMLGLASLLSLLLALALPTPRLATTGELWAQFTLLLLSGFSLLAVFLIARRPDVGWPITLAIGLGGLAMLLWSGRSLFLVVRNGGTALALGTIIPMVLWSSLVIAGACAVGWVRRGVRAS
jgi:hypothetical protein